jgi:hypothetical protein
VDQAGVGGGSCSVERTRLEGSVPKTAGEESTVKMAASGLASIADAGAARGPPTVPTRWALVLFGLAAAATSFTLALLSEDVSGTLGEPLLIAALTGWITISYVVCGLVAWWRRPANRFGSLLIVAAFVNFLSTLVWSSRDVLRTPGQALDLVPPVLPARLSGISGWAAEGPVRAELRRDRVRRCDRTRACSHVRRRLRAAQFVASAETSGQGVFRRRASAIARTLPIDRFCLFERRTIDGQRYVDPGRHVQLAEDVTDV